jgi:hypothetical protein
MRIHVRNLGAQQGEGEQCMAVGNTLVKLI